MIVLDVRVSKLATAQSVESIEQAIATVRHRLNHVTSSYHQLNSTNGAISTACLIEQAIVKNS